MAWARYDDELPMNRKVGALLAQGVTGAAALGLHLLANTWARHEGTGGHIPAHQPGLLMADAKLGRRLATMLETVGMFDPSTDGGWDLHDFDDFSDPNDDGRPAADKKREISTTRATAGRKGGLAKAANAATKRLAELQQTSAPVPVPVPSDHISDNDDSQNTAATPSSSSDRALYATLIAGELANRRTDIERRGAWIRVTAEKLRTERPHDLDTWLTNDVTPTTAAARILAADNGHPAGTGTTTPDWHANPDCPNCGGDGLASYQDEAGYTYNPPCPCRRPEPYERPIATIHHLRGATA